MCFSGFLYFLTELTFHLEKKKESFMTFVPVSSNGNSLSFGQPQLQEIQIPVTQANQSVVLYTFLKSGFDPEKTEGCCSPIPSLPPVQIKNLMRTHYGNLLVFV